MATHIEKNGVYVTFLCARERLQCVEFHADNARLTLPEAAELLLACLRELLIRAEVLSEDTIREG